jgi:hypothetical protein
MDTTTAMALCLSISLALHKELMLMLRQQLQSLIMQRGRLESYKSKFDDYGLRRKPLKLATGTWTAPDLLKLTMGLNILTHGRAQEAQPLQLEMTQTQFILETTMPKARRT